MNNIVLSLRFKDNDSVTYHINKNELKTATINGLINYLYNTKNYLKIKMDELNIGLDNYGLFPREGPYGLISNNSIPLNCSLDDNILRQLSNSVLYLLREGSSFY